MKKNKRVVKVTKRRAPPKRVTAVKPKSKSLVTIPEPLARMWTEEQLASEERQRQADQLEDAKAEAAIAEGQVPLTYAIENQALRQAPADWRRTPGCTCPWCIEPQAAAQLPPPMETHKAADSTIDLPVVILQPYIREPEPVVVVPEKEESQQEIIDRAMLMRGTLLPGEKLSDSYNEHSHKVLRSIMAEWTARGNPPDLADPLTLKALRYELAAELDKPEAAAQKNKPWYERLKNWFGTWMS